LQILDSFIAKYDYSDEQVEPNLLEDWISVIA